MARVAARLLALAGAALANPYSVDQEAAFQQTRQELLKRDPLARSLLEDKRLPRRPGDLHHRWGRIQRSGSISRHAQHQFMWYVNDVYGKKLPSAERRCLDWEGSCLKTIFNETCKIKDYLLYSPTPSARKSPRPTRRGVTFDMEYSCDAHAMADLIPHDRYDLVVANSVFEHMKQPFVVARQVALILKPGGFLLWHTPFMFPFHGVPADYFRYTHAGAAAVAEDAGLEVVEAAPDGGYASVLGEVTGLDSRYFTDGELQRVKALPHWRDLDALHHKVAYHLSTKMIARKPL
jgi:hypothetical protein